MKTCLYREERNFCAECSFKFDIIYCHLDTLDKMKECENFKEVARDLK